MSGARSRHPWMLLACQRHRSRKNKLRLRYWSDMWAPAPPAMPPGKCSARVGCEFFSSDRLLFAVEQIRFRVYMNLQLLPRGDRTSARPRGRTPLLPINLLGLHVGGRWWVCVCVCAHRTKVPSSFVPSSRLFFLASQCKQDMEKTECKYILTNPCVVLHISSLTMVECWIHKRNNICSRYRHKGTGDARHAIPNDKMIGEDLSVL